MTQIKSIIHWCAGVALLALNVSYIFALFIFWLTSGNVHRMGVKHASAIVATYAEIGFGWFCGNLFLIALWRKTKRSKV